MISVTLMAIRKNYLFIYASERTRAQATVRKETIQQQISKNNNRVQGQYIDNEDIIHIVERRRDGSNLQQVVCERVMFGKLIQNISGMELKCFVVLMLQINYNEVLGYNIVHMMLSKSTLQLPVRPHTNTHYSQLILELLIATVLHSVVK